MVKSDSFDINQEKCTAKPIYGDEIGRIYWVLNEETKDPSKEEIISWLREVWADPIALCQSFLPAHQLPTWTFQEFSSQFDSRTFSFLSKLGFLQDTEFSLTVLFNDACNGFQQFFKRMLNVPNDLVAWFFFILLSNEALYDPSNLQDVLLACDVFSQVLKYNPDQDIKIIAKWFLTTDWEMLETSIRIVNQNITMLMMEG